MRTVQMTIDNNLLGSVDGVVTELGTTRSAFIREALEAALKKHRARKLEAQYIAGYIKYPQTDDEFAFTEADQVWPEYNGPGPAR